MSGAAVVGGRAVADLLHSLVGLTVLMLCGWAIGWRVHTDVVDFGAAVGLLVLLRFALIWMGIYLGLVAGRPESVAAVQILVWPLGFLSNAFTDPASMPGWLGAIAEWNPLSATAAAVRELFGNPGWGGDSWAATHAVELARRLAGGADRGVLSVGRGAVSRALTASTPAPPRQTVP